MKQSAICRPSVLQTLGALIWNGKHQVVPFPPNGFLKTEKLKGGGGGRQENTPYINASNKSH
jgi:hypothetical protein